MVNKCARVSPNTRVTPGTGPAVSVHEQTQGALLCWGRRGHDIMDCDGWPFYFSIEGVYGRGTRHDEGQIGITVGAGRTKLHTRGIDYKDVWLVIVSAGGKFTTPVTHESTKHPSFLVRGGPVTGPSYCSTSRLTRNLNTFLIIILFGLIT